MIKRGFTLAEVLITLGIIGVISALTIPTFVSNAENKANAAKLSSLITDVQNAFTNMITSEAVLDMEETEFGQNTTISDYVGRAGILSKYLKLAGSDNNFSNFYNSETIAHIGNTTATQISFEDIYQLKNGALLFYDLDPKTKNNANTAVTSVDSSIGLVSIDVNGAAKPNLWGRDVFQFMLGSDGILYPAGSTDYQHVRNDKSAVACKVGDNTIGCTNTLIQDGFKVNY